VFLTVVLTFGGFVLFGRHSKSGDE
jgi:hypothetical protein